MKTRKEHKPILTNNQIRVRRAHKMVKTYYGTEDHDAEAYTDMITDIFHACTVENIDIDNVIRSAKNHLKNELIPDYIEQETKLSA